MKEESICYRDDGMFFSIVLDWELVLSKEFNNDLLIHLIADYYGIMMWQVVDIPDRRKRVIHFSHNKKSMSLRGKL